MSSLHAAVTVHELAMANPFANIVPDFNVFGAQFTTWWTKRFPGLWAVLIIGTGAYLLVSVSQMRKATANNVPGQVDEAKSHAMWAGISLGGLIAFAVIMGAVFT